MNDVITPSSFAKALALAEVAHHGQLRKGTELPYILHPLAVASLVIEFGGDNDQAIAGLLHDVVEDGGQDYAEIIRDQFGERVSRIVDACTDGTKEHKALATSPSAREMDWNQRKIGYINRLAREPVDALLVAACDKLHNVRSIIADVQAHGTRVFDRFTGGRQGALWYYETVCRALAERGATPAATLSAEVARLHAVASAADEPQAPSKAWAAQLSS